MISVIVPAYNVADYFDRCMNSLINQTYQDFEIIIVDNHSTDGTMEKEMDWVQRDERIRLIFQTEPGLGTARNIGIQEAKGEYIAFVDPDDWWDFRMLEKLYQEIKRTDADVCMCDRMCAFFDPQGRLLQEFYVKAPAMIDTAEAALENRALLSMIEVSVNGKLYKKSIFIKYQIWSPNCAAEDRAVMHYLIWKAGKVCRVKEALYFYHAERKGSNVNTFHTYDSMPECLEFIARIFEGEGEELKSLVQAIVYETALVGIKGIRHLSRKAFQTESERLIAEIKETAFSLFPENSGRKYAWGSFNLRRILLYAFPQMKEERTHYCFSSLISLFSSPIPCEIYYPSDQNRNKWLRGDFSKEFLGQFAEYQGEFIFIDFLEERFDIARSGDSYFTYSDIFQEVAPFYDLEYEVIDRFSPMATELWKEKCLAFIEFLLRITSPDRIILFKMKLSPTYGMYEGDTEFEQIAYIKKVNELLEEYYRFFLCHADGIRVVECDSHPAFFTDSIFPFGCHPHHLNDCFYHNKAFALREMITAKKTEPM